MSYYDVANNAIRTARYEIGLAADNIANANTPGYHVRRAETVPLLGASRAGSQAGLGAGIEDVTRIRDELVEQMLLHHVQALERQKQEATTLGHLEALFNEPSEGGLDAGLGKLFDSLTELSAEPDNPLMRRQVVHRAESVCRLLNELGTGLRQAAEETHQSVVQTVERVNQLARNIADLNTQIKSADPAGGNIATLSDRRDQLIRELAELITIDTVTGEFGQVSVQTAGIMLVGGGSAATLKTDDDEDGMRIVMGGETPQDLDVDKGKLGALLHLANDVHPQYREALDTLANGLRRSFNMLHTTGLGLQGRFTELTGANRFFSDDPFADVGYDVVSGTAETLIINVEDTATGDVTPFKLTLDTTRPADAFLASIRDAINGGVDHVTASISDGQLRLQSEEGYAFGFATPYDPNPAGPGDITAPDPTTPGITGDYEGAADRDYAFSFSSGGRVGQDAIEMQIDVRDASGTVIRTLTRTLDADYRPGDPIELEDGLKFTLAEGNVVAGDGFSVTARATMDTAGVLDALGLNVFFSGVGAEGLRVDERLLQEARHLAGAIVPSSQDNTRFRHMIELAEDMTLDDNTATFNGFYRAVLGGISSASNESIARRDNAETLVQALENTRDSVSGVDIDEEMVKIIEQQHIYRAALKYIRTLDEMLSSLLTVV